MYRSSIFNFDTIGFHWREIISKAGALTIAAFIILEIIVRLCIPAGQKPTGSWYNHTIRLQYAELQKLSHVDLYLTGSSISCVNIPVAEFDETLRANGIELTSFNAGIAGPDFIGVATAFRHLYWPQKQAKTVVIVLAPNDFNSANTAVRERTRGYVRSFQQRALTAATIDVLSQIYLFGFRKELKNYFKNGWQFDPVQVKEKGFTPLPNRQRTRWDTPYRIEPDGPLAQAVYQFTDWLLEQDVRVILISGLTEPAEKSRISLEEWRHFNEIFSRCAARPGVIAIDVSAIDPPAEAFVDQLHIHEAAARRYAKNLAKIFSSKLKFGSSPH